MIDFKKVNDSFFLLLGFNYINKCEKIRLPVTREETEYMASFFTEDFATAIGNCEQECSFGSFKLTDAPDHPFGWTDPRQRTLLHCNERSWHMIVPEIVQIGKLAQRALDSND